MLLLRVNVRLQSYCLSPMGLAKDQHWMDKRLADVVWLNVVLLLLPIGGQSGIMFDLSVFRIDGGLSRCEVSFHVVLPSVISVPVGICRCIRPMLRVVGVNSASSFK